MKRLIAIGLALLIAAPTVFAGRKQPKAGTIKDNVYTDAEYGFSMKIHDDWKANVGKKDDHARLVLTQKNPDIPPQYMDAEDYTKTPRLVVFVVKSDMNAPTFVDSLVDEDYSSDLKSDVLEEFEFLHESDIIPRGKSRIDLSGAQGVVWQGRAKYTKEVAKEVGGTSGEWVNSSYGGAIWAVDRDGYLYMFHMMCEWDFYDLVKEEVQTMIASFKFVEDEG